MSNETITDEQLTAYALKRAAETRRAWEAESWDNDTLSPLVFQEAELAWLETGLLPSPQHSRTSQEDIDTVCRAIVARTAAVLILCGWTPPLGLADRRLNHPVRSLFRAGC